MTGTASVTVNKATPTVTAWPTASAITAGQTLASSTLSGGAASVSGTFAWTAPATVPGAGIASESVTFTPTDATDYNTVTGTVSVTVNSALAPTVASTVPASGATNENIGNALSATFSIAMDSSTLTTSTFTLTAAGGASVSGLVTYNSSTATATFTPNASLAYSTAYTATITTGAKSSVGTPLASAYVWTFTTGANPNLVTIDFGTTYQTIRGFGGSTAWMGALPSTQMNALFGTGSGQIGLSILRVRIDPSGSSSNGWVTTNWGQELTNAEGAIAANPNAIVIAAPWTPPPSMKSNSSTVMGTLNTSSYADYANYLEDFVTYFANGNVNLYAISMQNEPDATVTYESCTWTPAAMDAWVESLTANGATDPLTTRLMMPESQNFLTSYSDPTLNDASAVGNVAIVAGHLYGVSPAYYSNAVSKGKEVWETEHYFQPAAGSLYSQGRPGISDALKAALEIHNSLVTGQYNAYLWWWVIDWNPGTGVDNSGLLDPSNNPTYYGWAMAQFAHFIQPGFVRASATANPLSGVYVSAYEGNGHYVIVAINSNTSSSSLSFTVSNASATSLTPYQTDANGGLAAQTAVSVTNGQFNYTLPAQSIITFYQ
jgi:glucuronoarabinoxylan endo-1,4-beta-xylanase